MMHVRRKAVVVFAVATMLATAGAACRRGGGADRLRQGNRLVTATISDPKTFNPMITVDATSAEATGPIFDALLRLDPKTTLPEPVLAESWDHDAAGTTWTFHLRDGVTWHDGTPFTADDVAFTFDAIYDPNVPNSLKHILTIGGDRIHTEVVDPHTIRLRLAEPFAPLLNSIGFDILPKHILGEALANKTFTQQWGVDTPPERIVGTGAYRMTRYVPSQFIQYERNPNYWMHGGDGAQLPRVAGQTLLIVPDQNTIYLKFLDNQLHYYAPRPEEVDDVQSRSERLNVDLHRIGFDTGMLFVAFNRNPAHYVQGDRRDPRLEWFTDKHFLTAIAHSIDADSMVRNTFFGYGQRAVSLISPENKVFSNPNLAPYPYDLDRAKALLEEGGYVDRDGDGVREDARGNALVFDLSTNAGNQVRERLCSILKEDWAKLGIQVNYRPLEFSTLVEKLSSNFEWDAMVMGFTGGVEPHNSANLLRSSGNLHLWQPNQPQPATPWEAEIDRELDAGTREIDVDARKQHYWRIQEILHRELPLIQLVRQERFIASKKYLEHFEPTVWGLYHPEEIAIRP